MATFNTVVDGYVAAREYDNATLGRLKFWVDQFGACELDAITPDMVDAAVIRLAERGKLRAGRGVCTQRTGKPLAGSSLNRYIGQLSQVFKYARRLRLLPRAHVPPTRGIEKAPEAGQHDRYFRPEEVERLQCIARLLDRKWGKLETLIICAYHTGLRRSSLLNLRWEAVDMQQRTLSLQTTKNGDPLVAVLSERATESLRKLPGRRDGYVFAGPNGTPLQFRHLWLQCVAEAGLSDRTFHSLRHGYGHTLAKAGVNQAVIMKMMGHRSLTASARYMHAGVEDKRAVVAQVFG